MPLSSMPPSLASDVPTLGYWIGVLVFASLIGLGLVTVVLSVRVERENDREEAVRPAIRAGLFDRLQRDEPDWESWIDDLTAVERKVLRELLNSHLRLVDGSDRKRLQPLGTALGVDRWALRTLETDDRYAKLTALSWLARIDHSHDPELIRQACATDAALRAAGARVMLEQRYPDAPERGMRLLLDDPTDPLSAFGLDTLYELARSRPDLLVE